MLIENLNVAIEGRKILNDINLKVNTGEIIHIIGPNGSGKSTFFKCLLGAIPYTGQINKNNSEIAVVADYTKIPEDLRVIDVIVFLNKTHGIDVIKTHTDLYRLCQLEEIKNTKISQLSTGEKRKLEVFVAIICGKKIFILDEMTNGLDHNAKKQIIQFIVQFRLQYKDIIFFYTTHQLSEAMELNENARYLFFNIEKKTLEQREVLNMDQLQNEFFHYTKGRF